MTDQPKPYRRLLIGAAMAASFAAGGLALTVLPAAAHGVAEMHGMGGHQMGPGMGAEHIDKMLSAIDATDDQRVKVKAILSTAFARMGAVHAGLNETHVKLHALITAPTIDRGALERLRATEMAQLDDASKVMVQALADAAEVLSPAQRAKLGDMMMQRHHG
jgi:Spy/CpxP family protein refolding chaperone